MTYDGLFYYLIGSYVFNMLFAAYAMNEARRSGNVNIPKLRYILVWLVMSSVVTAPVVLFFSVLAKIFPCKGDDDDNI